jgi:tRNA threonylcarbamoyladenosine biosynthesis protein TsaE
MPVLDRQSLEFISRGIDQTRRIGMRLGALLRPGDLVCLVGDLGSGKTTLVQGIASGWGSPDRTSSPTFVLVNVYRRPMTSRKLLESNSTERECLFHMDAYRISGAAEALELDMDAMLDQGPLVIEWADRIMAALPENRLWISLEWIDEYQRDMVFTAHGKHYADLLATLRRHTYGVQQ